MREIEIKRLILSNASEHPGDLITHVAAMTGLSHRTVFNHVAGLVREGALVSKGNTKGRRYFLSTEVSSQAAAPEKIFIFQISRKLEEAVVWERFIAPELPGLPENVLEICRHGVTEMVNNAIDHSRSDRVELALQLFPAPPERAAWLRFSVRDHGMGIFEKIREALGLPDHKSAALELYKGKFTTDPDRHSGEGIFFTSRAFDRFTIAANATAWDYRNLGGEDVDRFAHDEKPSVDGTRIALWISTAAHRTLKEVFDAHSTGENYAFTKTSFPVKAAETATGPLVSRSQAKRVLARLENFEEVLLDFAGVQELGQAFADDVFRVFRNSHPRTKLTWSNAAPAVERMIRRAAGS